MDQALILKAVSTVGPTILTLIARWLAAFLPRNVAFNIIMFKIRKHAISRVGLYCLLSLFVYFCVDPLQGYVEEKTGLILNVDALSAAVLVALTLTVADLLQFSKCGIELAEFSVKSGTDYTSALRLCESELLFLGTGAAKLTSNPEFEKAMKRCTGLHGSIKFLLSKPDNKVLTDAEKQAQQPNSSYALRVKESLVRLRHLKEKRAFEFEVRFYPSGTRRDLEHFRMMFINGSILLLSYNIYGGGDGSEAPQLIVAKSNLAHKTSFFYPYKNYYDRLWEVSEQWDFKEFT
jgi:hypothetical protein